MATLNRVRVIWTGVDGAPAYSNFYTQASVVTAATAHGAVAALISTLRPLFVPVVTASIEGDVAKVDTLTDTITGVETVPPLAYTGSGATTRLAPANQIVVRRLTGSYAGGRQIRGRWYIPYLTSATMSSAGDVNASIITTINGAMNTYRGSFPGGADVVYSRKNQAGYGVITDSVWTKFGVMRSRRD